MENSELLDDNMGGMQLSNAAKDHLRTASTWSKVIAIFSFICLGLGILGTLGMFAMGGILAAQMGGAFFLVPLFTLAILGVAFYVTLCLYRFSDKAKMAVATDNSDYLNASIEQLGKYFKINGILLIAAIALYLIILIVAGSMAGSVMDGMDGMDGLDSSGF